MTRHVRNPNTPADLCGDAVTPRDVVRRYHESTKHGFHRYAPSLGYLDWATQPHPFRRFDGAPLTHLPMPDQSDTPPYETLYRGAPDTAPVDLLGFSRLFFFSMAISAWKKLGDARWALRVNPSSGNLHPTEAYLICGPVEGLCDGPAVHHYMSDVHGLERRCDLDAGAWAEFSRGLPSGAFLMALTSIHWREAWKYGVRAYRYCQHDAGHALAAVRLSAALLGWSLRLLPTIRRPALAALLGLDREDAAHEEEPESPDMLLWLEPATESRADVTAPSAEDVAALRPGRWHGRANRLSTDHHPWPMIEQVERAVVDDIGTGLPESATQPANRSQQSEARLATSLRRPSAVDLGSEKNSAVLSTTCPYGAGRILRRRRSAVAMDGRTGLPAAGLFNMLARLLPDRTPIPWDAIPWRPCVHLGLFVHRIEGLAPGLYAFVRSEEQRALLRDAMDPSFRWQRPAGAPSSLPLYQLAECDATTVAAEVSCHQDIAADGAFSTGMLACFEPMIERHGAACYPQLFWETGVIGQVLYLEAEAAGLRSTGIGCFFDDPVHKVFGLRDRTFQSLYHFTVGAAVDDPRLTTLPAYGQGG